MAPKYILYYFDVKGRAEGVRYMMHYKKQEFDDRRIQKEQWPAIKGQMPTGQVPVLETGGQKLSQSIAIARYVGHKLGLYPSSQSNGLGNWEQAKLDEAVDLLSDVTSDIYRDMKQWFYEQDAVKKEQVRQELVEAFKPKLAQLTKLVTVSDQQPFLNGKKPMWADFVIASFLESLDGLMLNGQLANMNKALADYVQRIQQLDNVKEYIAQRKPEVI